MSTEGDGSSRRDGYGDPATRRRILGATWELVEEQGSAVRLVDAAERAGVSRQAVYLHFGDRTGLMLALVAHIDEELDASPSIESIFQAPTGEEALLRMVAALSVFTQGIDAVARVLEAAQYDDAALGAAWRDRLAGRRALSLRVVTRIADEGRLADVWTIQSATDLLYTVTLPGAWRELTSQLGWTSEQYADRVGWLLRRALLDETSDAGAGHAGGGSH